MILFAIMLVVLTAMLLNGLYHQGRLGQGLFWFIVTFTTTLVVLYG